MIAGSAFVDILAADNNQRRRFDFMDKICGLMALPGNNVTQIAFERRHLVDNEILKFFHDLRMLLHELSVNMKPGPQWSCWYFS